MSGFFGNKAPKDRTVCIVDIENGSVGAALVRLSHSHLPRLFAETRIAFPLFATLSADTLLKETERALREALVQTATTAARMRNHPKLADVGIIEKVEVFVGPPWTHAVSGAQGLLWKIEPALANTVRAALNETFDTLSVSFHAASDAVIHTTGTLFQETPDLLLFTVGGEVSELALLHEGVLSARATIPLGKHFLLRTLGAHAGLTPAEAHSALYLSRTLPTESPGEEALFAAAKRLSAEFSAAAADIASDTPVQGILVISNEPTGEWVAQNLAGDASLSKVFSEGTIIQALHSHHIEPHLAAHAARPDLIFMTEALFVDTTNK